MIGGFDGIARQNRDTVLPALVFQVESERVIHMREFREFRNLINAPGTLHPAIDFLQTDKIRMLLLNYASDARQIEFLVHADTDVNVVSHHADPVPACRNRLGSFRF